MPPTRGATDDGSVRRRLRTGEAAPPPGRTAWRAWLVPALLFLAAAAIRLAVAALVPFPATEGSAYYVGVARNMLDGDGLVTRRALELRDAAAGRAAAGVRALDAAEQLRRGGRHGAARVRASGPRRSRACSLGALLAPLAWGVARAAARAAGLDRAGRPPWRWPRACSSALASPFVLAAAVPDSYTPYVVAERRGGAARPAASVSAGASRAPSSHAGSRSGVLLGLAYLARQEVVWLGLAVVVARGSASRGRDRRARRRRDAAVLRRRRRPPRARRRRRASSSSCRGWSATPSAFGTPFPGQTLENAVLRRNEDIFAFAERPTLAAYLGQDVGTLAGQPGRGRLGRPARSAAPAGVPDRRRGPRRVRWRCGDRRPSGVTGALGRAAAQRRADVRLDRSCCSRSRRAGAPILHASGPLLVALTVAAALGADALLARISRVRGLAEAERRSSRPIGARRVTLLLLGLQVLVVSSQTRDLEDRYASLGSSLEAAAELAAASRSRRSSSRTTRSG